MKITILEYSAAWDPEFRSERQRLSGALSRLDARIEHIGSTAVPGLAAKPVIDIMIGLGREGELDALVAPVTALGYEYVREYEAMMPFRRFFRRSGDGGISFHLHAVVGDTPFWREHLLFRDLLRRDQELRTAYATLKRELAGREWPSGNDYAAAKGEFIRAALAAGRMAAADATGRVVYQVSTVPLESGEQLRPYYLQRYAGMIESTMAALAAGEGALRDHCQSDVWQRLALPHEFPALGPAQLKMMIVLEALFEQVRREEAPHLPGRLASVFTWPEMELARQLRLHIFPILQQGDAVADDEHLVKGVDMQLFGGSGIRTEQKSD